MSTTPSSRTSKHGSSRKRNNRIRSQNSSRSATPVTNTPLPELELNLEPPMDTPVEAEMEAYNRYIATPEFALMNLEKEAPGPVVEEEESRSDHHALLTFDEPQDEPVHTATDSFTGFDDAQANEVAFDVIYDFHDEEPESEPKPAPVAPAMATVGAAPAERPEPAPDTLTDVVDLPRDDDEPPRKLTRPEPIPPLSAGDSARTRAPTLVTRNPSSPSSLSRQLQNMHSFFPTSPQLPSLGFSNPLTNFAAPRISNVTVSGSGFNRPSSRPTTDPFVGAKEARRQSSGNFGERERDVDRERDRDRARLKMTQHAPSRGDSDEEDSLPQSTAVKRTRYPTTSVGNDKVVFASFATLPLAAPPSPPRRLLFVGYENGLQIWDTTHLGEVQEILNRRIAGAVVGCGVLPMPQPVVVGSDAYANKRPLIGIVVEEHDTSYLLVYSLALHEVVKKLDFSGASVSSFQASNSFVVVCTISPSSLHILCARTLSILHTIQSRQLVTFSRPVTVTSSQGQTEIIYNARQDQPHAVFTLSSRLLAFASVPPTPESSSLTHIYPRMAIPQSPSIQLGPLSVSQADIGNAALKVGGGLLSGMKVLGGIAVAAARGESMSTATADVGGGFRKFFSRSAPAATSSSRQERRLSTGSSVFGTTDAGEAEADSKERQGSGNVASSSDAAHITVLDLQPLLDNRESGRPERLSDFTPPSGQEVASLAFSEDGTNLAFVPSDGGTVRLYQIKPRSRAVRHAAIGGSVQSLRDKHGLGPTRKDSAGNTECQSFSGALSSNSDADASVAPWHVYDLRRGRTSGIIETVNYSFDSRWVGISTRKRTIHVFATNPYGGKPDETSHLEGRVKNVTELQPLSTEVRPIVRLRSNQATSPQLHHIIPLAFTFITSSSASLPTKFLPSPSTFSPPSLLTSSVPSSPPQRRVKRDSPRPPPRPTNYQDILVFDPSDGSLSLRRLTLTSRIAETSTFLSTLPIPTATSISLPGKGFMGRLSASPPKAGASVSTPAATEQLPTELVGKDSVIATWNLMRDSKWNDVKVSLLAEQGLQHQRRVVSKSEWLAQAELSTSSRSTLILPGSIYLSHQFLFHALGEDYHALIRRSHFDIPAMKIEVRREVEASAYSTGQGESFVSAGSSPQDIRLARSSFDEPLASAIFSGLDYSGTSPPVIPMLPNGARPGSFKAAIPIRSVAAGLTDGVNEGIGRLSRGIKKVRSPRLLPRSEESTPGPVPLEFDEEDEAFLSQGELPRERAGEHDQDNDNDNDADTTSYSGGGQDSQSVSTPSSNNNAPLVGGSESEGDTWGLEDANAVEEVEQFDEISAAGVMDEEQILAPTDIWVPAPRQKGGFRRKGM